MHVEYNKVYDLPRKSATDVVLVLTWVSNVYNIKYLHLIFKFHFNCKNYSNQSGKKLY
jgi:hypothetical protein